MRRLELPLLGSNQDSPDPEGPTVTPKFRQLADLYASSCHPMPEFVGFHAGLCRALLTQLSEFAESISAFQPLPGGPLAAPNSAVQEFLLRPAEPHVELTGPSLI
jgi:hypothetical protein